MMTTSSTNLASIVHESEVALKEAIAAQEKATRATQKADAARVEADAQRAVAYQDFLDVLTKEYPSSREQALSTAGESRAALEPAVRTDDGVFAAYTAWVEASIHVWELDSELAQIRDFNGVPVRSTDAPTFRFDIDISAIVDQIAYEFQDSAVQRITDRRTNFVNGRTSK